MRDYVIINGVNSNTITGLAISKLPPITKPMIRTNIEEIDGRDGDLITELGYSAYDKELEIGLYHDFDINAIIKYFTGEGTIIFSNEPDKFYNFKIVNQIDYEKLLKFKTAVVTIHCQPFKYSVTETPIELTPTTKTGSGTEITINDTREAPLDITLKGNTYQETTTGKQLFNTKLLTNQTIGTLNITVDEKGIWTFNGTSSSSVQIKLAMTNEESQKFANKTIYFNIGDTVPIGNFFQLVVRNSDGTTKTYQGINTTTVSGSWDLTNESFSNGEYFEFFIYKGSTSLAFNNKKYSIMISDTQNTPYEPYTGGIPAPNPSYPMTVQTVTGDNTVEVVGENILNIDDSNLVYSNSGGSYIKKVGDDVSITLASNNYNFGVYLLGKIKKFVGKTITFSIDENPTNKFNSCRFINCDSNGTNRTNLGEEMGSGNNSLTFTIPNQTYAQEYLAIRIYLGNGTPGETYLAKKPRVVYGDTPKSYESYTSQSYPINLGVENLFNGNNVITTHTGNWGITFENDILSIQHKTEYSTGAPNCDLGTLPSGTYVISMEGTYIPVGLYRNNVYSNMLNTNGTTFNCDGTENIKIYFSNNEVTTRTYTKLQIEKGSKVNSYTPYGTTPIEMCDIPNTDYEDSFIKNSGKNLANISIIGQVPSISTGELVSSASGGTTDYTQTDKTKNYVLTFTFSTTNQAYVFYYDENNTFLGYAGANVGATTGYQLNSFSNWNNTKYVRVRIDNLSNASQIMLNEGSTALPYEPYGIGEWYKKAEIGKLELGNLTYTLDTSSATLGAYFRTNVTDILRQGGYYDTAYSSYCTDYRVVRRTGTHFIDLTYCFDGTASLVTQLQIKNSNYNDATQFKNSLENALLYIPIATPTYTKITGSLASQLDDLLEANGYDGQTNIVQINDILPFEMDVSTTFLYPMEINNIGNIYAKPILTIEGTGNIDVILNGITILQIALGDTGEIAIDVPNLEAFKPSDNSLLNRLVTGDYMKLLIQEGDNTLDFSGNVTKATLTNYTRWI